MATRACGEPETFRRLVAAPCTADLRSEACVRAVVRGVDLHGPACLDLAIAASTAAALPPYRAYVCPRAAGRLARLCGTEDPGALGGRRPGGRCDALQARGDRSRRHHPGFIGHDSRGRAAQAP